MGVTILLGTFAVLAVATQWSHLSAFKRDKHVTVSEMANSAKLRPMLAAVAWQIFAEHPLQGVGFGQYKEYDQYYIAQRNVDMPLDQVRPYVQHNVLLALLTEVGLIGTVPFILVLCSWSRTALRLWTCSTTRFEMRCVSLVFMMYLINYVVNGMFHDVALMPMVNLSLFFLAGLMISTAQSARVTECDEFPQIRLSSLRPRLA